MSAQEEIPPNHPAAEQAVIGSMLISAEAAIRARQILNVRDFYDERNRKVFAVIGEMMDGQGVVSIDILTVTEELRFRGMLDGADELTAGFLANTVDKVVSSAHVEHYANIIKRASLERQISATLYDLRQERTPEKISRLGRLISAAETLSAYDILEFQSGELQAAVEFIIRKEEPGLPVGFPQIDEVFVGARGGDLVTVGARTSGGKTALMTKLLMNFASRGIPSLYITTEMTTRNMLSRILPAAARVPAARFITKKFDDGDITAIHEAVDTKLSSMPVKIWGRPRVSLQEIRGATLKAGAKVVFIDHLQRCRYPKGDNRAYQVQDFMAELKTFLLDANVIGFLACQLDRQMDKEPKRRPTMADFRDSGAVEHESDFCFLMWRPTKDRLEGPPAGPGNVALELIIAKQRNGPAPEFGWLQLNKQFVEVCERLDVPEQEELQYGG